MLRILESQAPAKQTATDTINTLSSRLSSATLLEDRRASILGLRSFAKLYPASVASGALRDLIACLRKDAGDSDTTKVVLETLLMLFAPDEQSPEASEEISLWLADEFTQRQDNITVLLDLLESKEFYLRLYSLQLISYISTARPERTQECIFSAPLGVSRLVAVLDDKREAVRNEALVLLIALTPSSTELQKVVAFENAFDRIFVLIQSEGSLTHGSTAVQDSLSLLANLLKLNVSNQSYFREIGCIPKFTKLLADVIREEDSPESVPVWVKSQRDLNVWGLLGVVQLFLVRGGQGTPLNQAAFWQSGMVGQILHLAFGSEFNLNIRAKCLTTCADLIRGNSSVQEQFGDLVVPKSAITKISPISNGQQKSNGIEMVNVIEALLKITLDSGPAAIFDLRLAACACVKAFFTGHGGIRTHVLRRAVEGFDSGDDEVPNILTVLMQPPDSRTVGDPYQVWMASVICLHLLFDNAEAKEICLKVAEGDASKGEEVITCVQGVTENLISSVRRGEDERIIIGYLMLLCVWLFEDPDAVNEFLAEGSNFQNLISASKSTSSTAPLVAGLCMALLGIIYEFSSKDSPIPRANLHNILTGGLGREIYVDRLTKLRENVFVRDFEVLQNTAGTVGLPNVFFDGLFIEFFKDNFSRLTRAVDRDPGLEVPVMANGVQKGISRELVDSLRAKVDEKARATADLEANILSLQSKLEQEELDHRRTRESTAVELNRVKQINNSLQLNHEDEIRRLENNHQSRHTELLRQHRDQLETLRSQLKRNEQEHEERMAASQQRAEAEIVDLKKNISELEARLAKAERDHAQDLRIADDDYSAKLSAMSVRMQRAEDKAKELAERVARLTTELEGERSTARDLKQQIEEKDSARKEVQTELDDLLIVFADLETKRGLDKQRLKALGEPVSEGEEDSDESGDDETGNRDEREDAEDGSNQNVDDELD